eukprot:6007025-Prymnesium_polylepis.1
MKKFGGGLMPYVYAPAAGPKEDGIEEASEASPAAPARARGLGWAALPEDRAVAPSEDRHGVASPLRTPPTRRYAPRVAATPPPTLRSLLHPP